MNMKCKRCGGEMREGIAMGQTFTGIPDFPNDTRAITLSPSGPGRVIRCLKCNECGYSVSRQIGALQGKSGDD